MKYIEEFRKAEGARAVSRKIAQVMPDREITLMEVCGTHTMSIFRNGIKGMLPNTVRLLSGPGCPVCVTSNYHIDKSIAYARREDVIVATFGDMLRVPGSTSSLEKEKARGRDIRVVYSPLDAVEMAVANPSSKVVFLGVGFETTAPNIAATVVESKKREIDNYFVFCVHKLIPPAMGALVSGGEIKVHGFICPGHVSTIIGSKPYEFIARDYRIPCVVAGFEPLDILQGILMLIQQVKGERAEVEIQYKRSVRKEGNPVALSLMEDVFEVVDSPWRGIGNIPQTGLKIREKYKAYDAEENIEVEVEPTREKADCLCGSILKGLKVPADCPLFGKGCTPEEPVGACMVSSEGTCAAHFKYRPWQKDESRIRKK